MLMYIYKQPTQSTINYSFLLHPKHKQLLRTSLRSSITASTHANFNYL